MNLEVDVMEGDQFSHTSGYAYQFRESKVRRIGFQYKSDWGNGVFTPDETPIDLPTFTRYCEGCGLTVRVIKPEPVDDALMDCLVDGCDCGCRKPQVETIKPPEWGVVLDNGHVAMYVDRECADRRGLGCPGHRTVRIDWGSK